MATPPVFTAGQILTAAQMNAIGMWEVKTQTTFSAASAVNADNVFSSDYTNYLLVCRYTTSTTTNNVTLRLRVGGVDAATNYTYQILAAQAASVTSSRTSGSTSFIVGGATNGTFYGTFTAVIGGPNFAQPTTFIVNNYYSAGNYTDASITDFYGNHSTSTAYDGLSLIVGTGTMTGEYSIYGLRN